MCVGMARATRAVRDEMCEDEQRELHGYLVQLLDPEPPGTTNPLRG